MTDIKIPENRFVEVTWEPESALLTLHWLPSTYEMLIEEYKSTLLEIADFIELAHIQQWLGYAENFAFVIPPELQEWTAGEFNQQLVKAGLKKMAIVVPADYIAHLGVQQSVSEMEKARDEDTFETKYFDNPEEAKHWVTEM